MNNLAFENRVSLYRKSEDIVKTVEELSSSYEKRVDFASKNLNAYPIIMRTSEIGVGGTFFMIVAIAAAAAVAAFYFIAAAELLFWDGNDFQGRVDSIIYKNIA